MSLSYTYTTRSSSSIEKDSRKLPSSILPAACVQWRRAWSWVKCLWSPSFHKIRFQQRKRGIQAAKKARDPSNEDSTLAVIKRVRVGGNTEKADALRASRHARTFDTHTDRGAASVLGRVA